MNVIYRDKQWTFEKACSVKQLLKEIRILPESVLVVSNGKLITEDRMLKPGDAVKIVAVISGG